MTKPNRKISPCNAAATFDAIRKKQSFILADGTRTSLSLEPEFWDALKEIARVKRTTGADIVRKVNDSRNGGNLTSAVRLFVLEYFASRRSAQPDSKKPAG